MANNIIYKLYTLDFHINFCINNFEIKDKLIIYQKMHQFCYKN